MTVPYTFGTATTSIPLSNLDANFNTPITLGNTSIYLGNTTTTIGNLTLTNATISSGTVNITNVTVTTANVTNITVTGTANIATGNITTLTSTSITDSGLTSGRVTYAGTAGLLQDSANLLYSGTDLTVYGIRVGRGGSAVSTNTAVGASALAANTSGADNTALGLNALAGNLSGINNTASGRFALTSNTTGTGNTGSGYSSLATNIAGNYNTASGGLSLFSNTGSYNTAIGYDALNNNTTASYNTALGWSAGYANTTGAANTYIGIRAGVSANTASYNTFVGTGTTDGAGATITTGGKNTILGGYTGNQDSLDIRTASNYVVLSDGDGNRQITMAEGQTLALDSAVPNSGTGVTFPATQSASSNANTLDDYEEGTFTPILGTSNGGTATMSLQEGKYVKVGKIVQFSLQIAWTAKNTWDFNTRISGLPFTATSNTGGYGWPNSCQMDANALTTLFIYSIESNSTIGYIQAINVTGAQLTESSFPSSGRVLVNGCYQTT